MKTFRTIIVILAALLTIACYSSSAFISPEPSASPVTASPTSPAFHCVITTGYPDGTVNLRKGAGTQYGVYKVVHEGDRFRIVRTVGDWYAVVGDDGSGFIRAEYCEREK